MEKKILGGTKVGRKYAVGKYTGETGEIEQYLVMDIGEVELRTISETMSGGGCIAFWVNDRDMAAALERVSVEDLVERIEGGEVVKNLAVENGEIVGVGLDIEKLRTAKWNGVLGKYVECDDNGVLYDNSLILDIVGESKSNLLCVEVTDCFPGWNFDDNDFNGAVDMDKIDDSYLLLIKSTNADSVVKVCERAVNFEDWKERIKEITG